MTIDLTIYGNPIPQGRPRFARIRTKTGKDFMTAYDPKTSRDWKDNIREQAILNKVPYLTGPLTMTCNFYLSRPQSLPKKTYYHVKKPDLDNLLKAVKDSLTGLAYKSDSQIYSLMATKDYGEPPKVIIRIEEVT